MYSWMRRSMRRRLWRPEKYPHQSVPIRQIRGHNVQLPTPNRSRILVTGAHGMLGATLVPHLSMRGHTVVEAPSRARAPLRADLRVAENVRNVMDHVCPDVVVNLAALSDVDYCEEHPEEAYDTNAALVQHLAAWIASSSPLCTLIHISTDQMYDGAGPHDERVLRLCNYYGYSKILSEQYAAAANATTLRTNFFGRSMSEGRASLSDWIITSLRARQPITVFDDVHFTPLSMATLAESIERVIANPVAGVFNLGSSEGMTKADFAFALVEAVGLPTTGMRRGSVDEAPRAARRPRDMRMASQRFHAAFGGTAPRLIDEIHRAAKDHRADAR